MGGERLLEASLKKWGKILESVFQKVFFCYGWPNTPLRDFCHCRIDRLTAISSRCQKWLAGTLKLSFGCLPQNDSKLAFLFSKTFS